MDKKIDIKLNSSTDEIMSVWEIQDLLKNLGNNYYKLNLVVEINKMIYNGVDPDNIVVFNESFDFKTSFSYLKEIPIIDIDEVTGAKQFYHLGEFTSIFPNTDVVEINAICKLFREINSYLFKRKSLFMEIKLLNKDRICEYFKLSTVDACNIIKQKAIGRILKLNIDKSYKDTYKNEINLIVEKYLKEIDAFKIDIKEINDLKKDILENNIIELSDKRTLKFNKFYERLQSLERPIVGTFNADYSSIEILCTDFICKETRNKYFLDLKNFSHNSPTMVYLGIGMIFTLVAVPLLKQIKDGIEESITYEKDGNVVKDKEESIEKLNNTIKNLEDEENLNNLNLYNNIENNFIRSSILNAKDDIINKTIENITYYNFANDKVDCNVIEFTPRNK
ncbi:MAG: hypothetical protein RSD47_02700 [Romboutsia sp.]